VIFMLCVREKAKKTFKLKELTIQIVTIKIANGRTTDQKRKLVKKITDSLVSILDVKSEWVSVLFEEFDRENWSGFGRHRKPHPE
jgi:4-oxalocrotonate tautomerase